MQPLCFVLMPFGTKKDASEKEINFDTVYQSFIKPAIILAGLDPIRADEEQAGGFIHKPMYERLMFCDFSVADLSFANANVFYELGIRHALKPCTTVSIFETGTKLPFDTAPLRTFNYDYKDGAILNLQDKITSLANLIKVNLNATKLLQDSPIAQLITGYKFPDLNYLQEDADAFKDWVTSNHATKDSLEDLAKQWKQAGKAKDKSVDDDKKKEAADAQIAALEKIKEVEQNSKSVLGYSYELLYALLNAYKAVGAFTEITVMLKPLVASTFKDNIYIKQQLAMAYNKIKERQDAEEILKTITEQYGADPETNGLLGAVYKGLMDDYKGEIQESGFRTKAIKAYLEGFDADPRDYYPGINALSLMFYGNVNKDVFSKYLPLVQFAVERQLKKKSDDYWLQATRLEIAILNDQSDEAVEALSDALACDPDDWAKSSTKSNIQKLYDKKLTMAAEADLNWLKKIIENM
ncbi:MAG: TRAFs-binding domain-containing protein [Ferruginibacter sp.]